MKTKRAEDLKPGDVIHTPSKFLDPLEDPDEHTVVKREFGPGVLLITVQPDLGGDNPWRFDGAEKIFVLREGEPLVPSNIAVIEESTNVVDLPPEDDPPPVVIETRPTLSDNDDPLEALGLARARLRALGYVLGAVRGSKLRVGDVLMVNGAGDLRTVESLGRVTRSGVHVKLANTEPEIVVDPTQPFLCMRPKL